MAEEIYQLSATEISSRLAAGKLTSRAVVEALIARYHQLNKKIGAFTSLDEKDVLAQADASDARLKPGKVISPLD